MHDSKSLNFGDIKFFDLPCEPDETNIDLGPIEGRKRQSQLPLTFRKPNPVRDAGDYIPSKIAEKHVKYTTAWEDARKSSGIYVFNTQKQLRDKMALLTGIRKYAQLKRKSFDKKWDKLRTQQLTFKTLFIKFNTFVKENQEKRERALRKISEEKDLQYSRSLDMELMQDSYADLSDIKNSMEKKIKDHRIYEDYLSAVVVASTIHKNVNDVLYRYESLLDTRNFLSIKQQEGFMALQNAQAAMKKLIEEKTLTLVGLQNQLSHLQERYDLASVKSLQWETTVSKIQDIYNRELANTCTVKTSIDYIYADMCKRKYLYNISSGDHETKLAFIKQNLHELCHVLRKLISIRCNDKSLNRKY